MLALAPLYAMLIGALVRLSFVLASDSPLNDGGLFYCMTQELQRAHYRLPSYSAYNSLRIPFAYPPLGLYLAGLLADLGPWTLLDVFCFLPLAINVLALPAFYALSRCFLSREASIFAIFAFALLPRSFHWLIMGGGITRSPGFLFAILAARQIYLLYTRREGRHVVPAILFAGGAVLSHLEMGLFLAYTAAIFFLAYGRNRSGLAHSLLVAIGTLAITAPWWGTVIARHGLTPFLAASEHGWALGSGLGSLLSLWLTEEAAFPVLGFLALLGALSCLRERRFLLPIWLAGILILDPRGGHTTMTLPLALLIGVSINEQVLPALSAPVRRAMAAGEGVGGAPTAELGPQTRRRLPVAVLGFIFAYALLAALLPEWPLLTGLSRDEREAMQWVAQHTPQSSTFLVVTGDMWASDRSSEWFPTLAERASVATVQGGEWQPEFARRIERSKDVQKCAMMGVDCLEDWERETGIAFTYLYVPKRARVSRIDPARQCASGLRSSLRCHPEYRVVYDGPGATIYGRLEGSNAVPSQEAGPAG